MELRKPMLDVRYPSDPFRVLVKCFETLKLLRRYLPGGLAWRNDACGKENGKFEKKSNVKSESRKS